MAEFITLACPSCGGKVQVSPGSNRYACEYCGSEHILENSLAAAFPPQNYQRTIIPVPNGVTVKENQQGLRIVRRWFSLKYIPLAFFCVAWDSFLIFWYGAVFSGNSPWIMAVFPIAHLVVGIGLTYSVLAGFLNRTVLEVTPKEFSVRHEPLLWPGEKTLITSDITQLFTKEKVSRGEHTTFTYELWAVTRDGKSQKLISGLESSDVPQYLEQQLETWLQIADRPIAGEITH